MIIQTSIPMKSVFVLEHLHTHEDGEECWKRIGIYTSREEALAAIERAKILPGFSDYPDLIDHANTMSINGFNIDEYELNRDFWSDGYSTAYI
jgi:hypothetical protein